MKKARDLASLTGVQILVVIESSGGRVFTYATPKLQDVVQSERGRSLLQECLGSGGDEGNAQEDERKTSPEEGH